MAPLVIEQSATRSPPVATMKPLSPFARVRRRLDVFLHPWRRDSARARVRALPSGGRIVFVCQGNLCRSPFAERLFRREIERATRARVFDVASAGFVGPDRPPPPEAIAAANKLGVDLTSHRSRLITSDVFTNAILIVVMSAGQGASIRRHFRIPPEHMLILGDLDPLAIDTRTIRDPWNAAEDIFDESYARIARCVRALVTALTSPRRS